MTRTPETTVRERAAALLAQTQTLPPEQQGQAEWHEPNQEAVLDQVRVVAARVHAHEYAAQLVHEPRPAIVELHVVAEARQIWQLAIRGEVEERDELAVRHRKLTPGLPGQTGQRA